MRVFRFVALLPILAAAALADTRVVRITDTSAVDSPVRSYGSVTIAQEILLGGTSVSSSQDWMVRNISPKPIVAVIESLLITYADGQKSGGIQRYEQFFYTDLMKPGDELSLFRASQSRWAL